jgi:hypothetical protein
MYYSVQAYFANLYGSVSPSPYIWSMVTVGAVAMLINIAIVAFIHKPMPVEAPVKKAEKESVNNSAQITA